MVYLLTKTKEIYSRKNSAHNISDLVFVSVFEREILGKIVKLTLRCKEEML